MTAALFAIGLGTGTRGARGNWLEVFYPAPQRNADTAVAAALAAHCGYAGGNAVLDLAAADVDLGSTVQINVGTASGQTRTISSSA